METNETKARGVFRVRCEAPDGALEWEAQGDNALTNEGANYLRDLFFKDTANPGDNIYIGLSTVNGIAATAVLATSGSYTEATGGGYVRKQVTAANWAIPSTGQANNTAAPATWTMTATVASIYELVVVAQGAAQKLFSHALLTGGPYTVNSGSTLNVTYTWTVS